MRFRFMFAALFTLIQCHVIAQAADVHAVTEDGRRVLLSPDGNWQFDKKPAEWSTTQTSPQSPFQTQVKGYTLTYDTTQWVIQKKDPHDSEFNRTIFRHKSLPIEGAVIADEMASSTDEVKNIIIFNANAVANPKITVLRDETSNVNGKQIGIIRYLATIEKIDFLFESHYYGSNKGNIQVVCITTQNLFAKYAEDCKKFTDGLTIQ